MPQLILCDRKRYHLFCFEGIFYLLIFIFHYISRTSIMEATKSIRNFCCRHVRVFVLLFFKNIISGALYFIIWHHQYSFMYLPLTTTRKSNIKLSRSINAIQYANLRTFQRMQLRSNDPTKRFFKHCRKNENIRTSRRPYLFAETGRVRLTGDH